jgi:hypothetical protein
LAAVKIFFFTNLEYLKASNPLMTKLKKTEKTISIVFLETIISKNRQFLSKLKKFLNIAKLSDSIYRINEIILSPDDEDPFTVEKTEITVLSSDILSND